MKVLTALPVALLALSGCARTPAQEKDRTPAATPSHFCVPSQGPSCRARIFWACPEGFVDGCKVPANLGNHVCVSRDTGVPCAEPLALNCEDGFEDGCRNGSSENHQCLTKKGLHLVPCSEAASLVCPQGFRDVCLQDADAPVTDDGDRGER